MTAIFLSQLIVMFGFFQPLVLISVYCGQRSRGPVRFADRGRARPCRLFLEFTTLSLTADHAWSVAPVVAGFVATLYIFNRLIGDSEMVVLQTAGLSPLRLLRP